MSTVAVMNPEDFPKVPLVINGISSRFIRENRVIPLELRNNVCACVASQAPAPART